MEFVEDAEHEVGRTMIAMDEQHGERG